MNERFLLITDWLLRLGVTPPQRSARDGALSGARLPYPISREGTEVIFGKGGHGARELAEEDFTRMKKLLGAVCIAALLMGCERSDMGGVGSEAASKPGEGRGDRSYRSSGAPESGGSQTGSGTGRSTNGPGGADIESR